mmetsp:Transcript_36926/g.91231  ORF Transcript_36926/g.91231 Transcript_36926/m.91231 type:complete len:310 (+) Transcript_36926:1222-2151(+)
MILELRRLGDDRAVHGGHAVLVLPHAALHVLGRRRRHLLELLDALQQRAAEALLLLRQDLRHARLLRLDLGEHRAKQVHHHLHQAVEEPLLGGQLLAAEAHGAAQHPPQHVVAAVAAGRRAVADGERQRADVVRHHAVRHVLLAHVLHAQLAAVRRRARARLDGGEDGHEDVGVVVGQLALQDTRQALEAHAGVHVLRRQRLQHPALLAVKLDEHQVPDLQAHGVVVVNQGGGVAPADAVVVDFRAGAARAHVAHLPEVVRAPEGQHLVRRQQLQPDVARVQVRGQALRLVAAEVRGIQVGGGQAVGHR